MKPTTKQAHVLKNLNRVVPLPSRSALPRYQLDGVECTAQITGLTVKKLIRKHSGDVFVRMRPAKEADKLVGERQNPLPSTIDALKAALSAPAAVKTVGAGKR